MFALIVGDCEIDALEEMSVGDFLFGADRVNVIGIFGRRYDAFPGPFEVDL